MFKGLGVTLVGVMPSRAVYFATYDQGKRLFDNGKRSPFKVHVFASVLTGIVNVTWTNPLYMIRTRQQLKVDGKGVPMLSFWRCALDIYKSDGLVGFARGMSASYIGIFETVIVLVLWEHYKKKLNDSFSSSIMNSVVAAAGAKLVASTVSYPHEVIRTRLRETSGPNRRYRTFSQTVSLTVSEEGIKGLYRGLTAQLIRVVPNHAIMFLTFEYLMRLLGQRTDT